MKKEAIIRSAKVLLAVLTLSSASFTASAQFQEFADSYSILSTIAGKGEQDNGNAWKAEFEGGLATDAELTRPHFAMADSAGNIFIADKDAHGIRKVTTDGKIYTVAGTSIAGDNGDGLGSECQLSSPNGLWVKADGTVYILDLGNSKIRRLDTDGQLVTIVDDEAGYSLGRGIWVTESEDSIFYASGSRIKMWTASGGVVDYATGFTGLGNICMDKNGYLVATDRSANRVYRISKDGSTKETIAGNGTGTGGGDGFLATETGLEGVRGVWFLDDNSCFVATHGEDQVWYIDTQGKIYLFLNGKNGDEYHSGDGENYRTPGYKISEARSVSVDYDGNVIITENDNGFVRKIKNDYTYYYTGLIKRRQEAGYIKVHPNPATSYIEISFPDEQNREVEIYSATGQKLFHDHMSQNHQLDISGFGNGIYLLVFKSKGRILGFEKIVKN